MYSFSFWKLISGLIGGLASGLIKIENVIASSLEGVERWTSCRPVWSSFFI